MNLDLSWLVYPLSFIFTLGIVVTIHEFGHFIVARYFGVRVLRFSVGFGRVLFSRWDKRGTEFCVCAIPLGGYVRLLDSRQDEIAPENTHEDFSRKSVYARLAVYAAGPLINTVFAVFVFAACGLVGVTEIRPVIGLVEKNSIAAEAGFIDGDEIVAIEGRSVSTWEEVTFQLIESAGHTGQIPLTIKAAGDQSIPRDTALQVKRFMADTEVSPLDELGILPKIHIVPPIIGVVTPDLPASVARWQAGDLIQKLDETAISHWKDLYLYVRNNPKKEIQFELLRDGTVISGVITPRSESAAVNGEQSEVGKIGAGPQPFELDPSLVRTRYYGPLSTIAYGFEQTWVRVRLVVISIGKLLTGALAIDNVTGPVTIAEIAGKTAQGGLSSMLNFLGYLSISLGIFNLLPVPMLDGGHIAYGLVEAVRKKPVSIKMQERGMAVGFALLGSVMILALFNDFVRLFSF